MKKVTISFFLLISVLSSCTTVKMALNESQWPQKKEYTVTNQKPLFKQQKLAFGEYRTQEVKRSWTTSSKGVSGISVGEVGFSVEHIKKKQTFRFQLQNEQQANSTVFCANNIKIKDLVLGQPVSHVNTMLDLLSIGIDTDNQFYARIYTPNSSMPWELLLDNMAAQRSKNYAGSLMLSPDNYYSIVPVNKLQGKNGPISLPFGTVGFEFRNMQNQPVAAVSLLDKGTVYLQEIPEEEKFLLANACAALLLQQADL